MDAEKSICNSICRKRQPITPFTPLYAERKAGLHKNVKPSSSKDTHLFTAGACVFAYCIWELFAFAAPSTGTFLIDTVIFGAPLAMVKLALWSVLDIVSLM